MPQEHNPSIRLMPQGHKGRVYGSFLFVKNNLWFFQILFKRLLFSKKQQEKFAYIWKKWIKSRSGIVHAWKELYGAESLSISRLSRIFQSNNIHRRKTINLGTPWQLKTWLMVPREIVTQNCSVNYNSQVYKQINTWLSKFKYVYRYNFFLYVIFDESKVLILGIIYKKSKSTKSAFSMNNIQKV